VHLIDSQINKDSHGASIINIVEHEGTKLRLHVLDNRVARRARVERWSGSRWEEVYGLGPSGMKTRVVGAGGEVTVATFAEDLEQLLRVALEVTTDPPGHSPCPPTPS
jgi:hypothetical protein